MRIAILEDDQAQAELLQHWLTQAGLTCLLYNTGTAFRSGIAREHVDLMIIDWLLPDDDGLAVLDWLRGTLGSRLPVMFATTRAEEKSLVTALDKGADDYLIKPLRQSETVARVHALLRRGVNARPESTVTLGGVHIDVDQNRVTSHGAAVALTDRELQLAVYLLRHHGRLLTRHELLQNVWHTSTRIVTRTIDTHVSRLRAKLGLTPEHGFELSTVYHKGYRLAYHPLCPGDTPRR